MCKSVLLLQYLESINQFVRENLRQLEHAPGIQMQDVPRDLIDLDNLDRDDEADVDVRESAEELERRCVCLSQILENTFGLRRVAGSNQMRIIGVR